MPKQNRTLKALKESITHKVKCNISIEPDGILVTTAFGCARYPTLNGFFESLETSRLHANYIQGTRLFK